MQPVQNCVLLKVTMLHVERTALLLTVISRNMPTKHTRSQQEQIVYETNRSYKSLNDWTEIPDQNGESAAG